MNIAKRSEFSLVARESFLVTAPDGCVFSWVLELHKNGFSEYGEQYCILVLFDADSPLVIDAPCVRHCPTPEFFHDWSFEWLRDYCCSECEISRCSNES